MSTPSAQLPHHGPDPSGGAPAPYRIFFPLGVLLGSIGVGLWPAYAAHWIDRLPGQWHIDIQLQGFLFAFVLGFLLTALPRFSLTSTIRPLELTWFLTVFVLGNLATIFGEYRWGHAAFFLNMTGIVVFAVRRFRKRNSQPPDEFVFVFFGILMGWIASALRMIGSFGELPELELAVRRLIPEGMMVMLILGIGGKLAPMFFGFPTSPPIQSLGTSPKFLNPAKIRYMFLATGLILAVLIEHFVSPKAGLYLRAIIATPVFFLTMKIHRWPRMKGFLVHALRFSMWAVFLALWGVAIHSQYRVETLHVMFIGGFGVMILSIATRVILSHGNHPIELERNSKVLLAGWLALSIATVLRSIAGFFPERYFPILGFAGALWVIGLLAWGIPFSGKAVKLAKVP